MRYIVEWHNDRPVKLTAILAPVDNTGTFYPKIAAAIAPYSGMPLRVTEEGIIYEVRLYNDDYLNFESIRDRFREESNRLQAYLSNAITEYNRFAIFHQISQELQNDGSTQRIEDRA